MASNDSSPSGIHTQDEVNAIFASDSAYALRMYMQLVEDSESPMSFYLWSLISMAGGLLGRRCYFDNGPFNRIFPNQFIVLLGPSGVRKSTSITTILKLIEQTTLNLGPTDTGGQRYGIMAAMQGLGRSHRRLNLSMNDAPLIAPMLASAAKNRPSADIYLASSELGRLLGTASREMADFMTDIGDGQDIVYQTKMGEIRISNVLASLLSATTTSSLATMLPESIIGHGLLSRFIFVYEDKKRKSIPLPKPPEDVWYARFEDFKYRLSSIDAMTGPFDIAKDAASFYEIVYPYMPAINDSRMADYGQRRAIHLLKTAMALAALRGYMRIELTDMQLAHEMLATIEPRMHRALDYVGRNKLIRGKMLMLEYLRQHPMGYSATLMELCAIAAPELVQFEAEIAIQQMLALGELTNLGETYSLGTARNEFIKNRLIARKQTMIEGTPDE